MSDCLQRAARGCDHRGVMRSVVMAIVMTLTCLDLSFAQTRDQQQESLRGLPGGEVVVEEVKSDGQVDGLSQESIRAAVELILRSKGIRVLTQSERSETPAKPYLYVSVGTDKEASGQYSFSARVELYQAVSLVQRPQHIMPALSGSSLAGSEQSASKT
ncbi:MAG: hypothetical protein HXY51_10450 [Nitrospirae bacterium]|nr:hypothetical protein [Nitrospirota bacterium]